MRGGQTIRSKRDGDGHGVELIDIWGPMLMAGIRICDLYDTVTDRSIIIPMRRRGAKDRPVEKVRSNKVKRFAPLRRDIEKWAFDNEHRFQHSADPEASNPLLDPYMPPGLNDRQEDAWVALFAIADCIGGKWPERARGACSALQEARSLASVAPESEELLRNIYDIFKSPSRRSHGFISSEDLCGDLNNRADMRWGA